MSQELEMPSGLSGRSSTLVDITAMATFVTTVNATSYTEAARRMGTSKSVVSRRISEMEAQLGVRLMDRTAAGICPTEVGAVYYAKCVRILESIEAANEFVTGFHDGVRGSIRVSVPRLFCASVMAPLLTEFAGDYPELRIEVDVDDREASLQGAGFDVALRIGRLADSSMIARTISTTRHWICASASYLQSHGHPVLPEQLEQHDCLLYSTGEARPVWCLQGAGQSRLVRVRERFRSACYVQLLEATKSGLGIGLLPGYLINEAVSAGELVILMPDCASPRSPISLVYPSSRRASQKVQALVGFLSERIPDPLPWDSADPKAASTAL